MLTLIEPKEHHLYQSKIDSLLSLLKIYQGFTPSAETRKNATFIIGEDKKYGVYGGAIIYAEEVKSLYHKLATPLLEFFPKKEQIWCGRLCLCIDQEDRVLRLETLDLCEDFYGDLYKILIKIGQKQKTSYFALTLPSEEYRNTITYGDWPYLLEISPSHSPDYRFHGLLALKPKTKRKLEAETSRGEEFDDEDDDLEEAFFLGEEDDFDAPTERVVQ